VKTGVKGAEGLYLHYYYYYYYDDTYPDNKGGAGITDPGVITGDLYKANLWWWWWWW